jgi:outer membrane lipoprotein SlyB
MKTNQSTIAVLLTAAVLTAGCAAPNTAPGTAQGYPTSSQRGQQSAYGVVESIDTVQAGALDSVGIGTVGGAVVGGLLGNQVGSGSGRKAATVAGALGGAAAGNQVDQRRNTAAPAYDIRVRLDDGSTVTMRQEDLGNIRVGNRVRVGNDRVYRY